MANNTQRDELHKTIWEIADSLRGAVGGWEFKAYVLGTFFYRYISENITRHINQLQAEACITGYDYAQETDENAEDAREGMVAEKGYFILLSEILKTLRSHQGTAIDADVDVNVDVSVDVNVDVSVGENERKILSIITAAPKATAQDMADSTGLSKRQIQRLIKRMRERGLIARVGSDKNGHWEIKK